ncbi:C45 family autoproteolytic acyltransferase/hydolase [Streptomyces roseolus]|uniref:C45 family autoproteolytic acyltransferase/hydolase n=1 Tax=Streptomyces roseolus TaxID=67358 RepID=UPI00167189F2|nr:C45 family peptidase [Streptomyces roseolus]GGR50981.1 peptidase C45 [Streptomyces roseolus]
MSLTAFPRPGRRLHVAVDAADPRERGRLRGARIAEGLRTALDVYDRLFALAGIPGPTVRDDAHRALDAIDAFRPALREQIEGIAEGAGAEPWRVAALNARTEILARSRAVPPGECSTVVRRVPAPDGGTTHLGVQTWDWHVELGSSWHTVDSAGGAHRHVGLTEHGILAKIGVNSAGLALHFNILGHRDDRVGGLPVHVLAALVLEEADDAAHAVELIRSAPLASSGSFLLFDQERAVLLDLSPDGVSEVPPTADGTRLRTNHFLTPGPARREKTWLYQPDSGERYAFLRDRLDRAPATTHDDLLRLLVTGPGEPPVSCVPDPDAPLGRRWASLATVLLDPGARTARILDGTPAEHADRPWYTLRA